LTKWQPPECGSFSFLSLLQIALLSCLDFMSSTLIERESFAITGPIWQRVLKEKDKKAGAISLSRGAA
jgi:hypothetical protein